MIVSLLEGRLEAEIELLELENKIRKGSRSKSKKRHRHLSKKSLK